MRKSLIIVFMLVAFFSGFLGRGLLNVRAEEEAIPATSLYYTSIQIEQGDNLWTLANRYAEGSGYTTKEYISELKRMNQLKDEQIRSGEYLTVMYVSAD